MPFPLEHIARWFATAAVMALASIPLSVLVDLVFRKFGLPVVIGLETLEYLLLASVVLILPRLSLSAWHIALVWQTRISPLRATTIRLVCIALCGVMSIVYSRMTFDAMATSAMFRNGLDIPEGPIWMTSGLTFAITGMVELATLFKERK